MLGKIDYDVMSVTLSLGCARAAQAGNFFDDEEGLDPSANRRANVTAITQ
jgi:hypothetical protein